MPRLRLPGLETVILRPKTFLGPERLGVFEILFDWIREGGGSRSWVTARTATSSSPSRTSSRRSCVASAPRGRSGLQRGRGSVRQRAGRPRGAVAHAGSRVRLLPVPARPAELVLRGLELLRLSPLAEWHYRTAHRDSYVAIDRARELLGWDPRCRTPRLCARRTTGTSRTAITLGRRRRDAPRAVGPARSACSSASLTVCSAACPGTCR